MTRRAMCALLNVLVSACAVTFAAPPAAIEASVGEWVSAFDLRYVGLKAKRSEGQPIGTGRFGGLLSVTRGSNGVETVRLQVNHSDVFGFNGASQSASTHQDYCHGAGDLALDFGEAGVFGSNTVQHLSLYDGECTVDGGAVSVRVVGRRGEDALVYECRDARATPRPATVALSMLRPARSRKGGQTATSRLYEKDGCLLLEQEFVEPDAAGIRENDHFCRSLVAVGVAGVEGAVRVPDPDPAVRGAGVIGVPARKGAFRVIVTCVASMQRDADLEGQALGAWRAASRMDYERVRGETAAWWHEYWGRSWIRAPRIQALLNRRTHLLYQHGCAGFGTHMPRYNGMLWVTEGDKREWGASTTFFNQFMPYLAMDQANHPEVTDGMLDYGTRIFERCARSAQQTWGSQGVFMQEAESFSGPAILPEDVAAELRDTLLWQKPMGEALKKRLSKPMPHNSRFSFTDGKLAGWHTHWLYDAGIMAQFFWERYEYTRDEAFLKDRAYPWLKGVVEFYRNYPRFTKDEDGLYHLHNCGWAETIQGRTSDCIEDLAMMRGILPIVIGVSARLGVDADLRPKWQDMLDHLAPYPTSETPGATLVRRNSAGRPTWAVSVGKPEWHYQNGGYPGTEHDIRTRPILAYDLVTLESTNAALLQIATDSLEKSDFLNNCRAPADDKARNCSRFVTLAARVGKTAWVKAGLEWYNRLQETRFKSVNWLDNQNAGAQTEGMQQALLQSIAAGPDLPPVIHVFPAWPRDWDASFKLRAKGGFVVAAELHDGIVRGVELTSELGRECRMRNPWPGAAADLHRDGRKAQALDGELWVFETRRGERLAIALRGPDAAGSGRATP